MLVVGAFGGVGRSAAFTAKELRARVIAGVLKKQFAAARRLGADQLVALDDEDALNALLYELWRSGYLDRRLAGAGLDRRFNDDPLVTELLSIRISPPRLALPPVIAAISHSAVMFAGWP